MIKPSLHRLMIRALNSNAGISELSVDITLYQSKSMPLFNRWILRITNSRTQESELIFVHTKGQLVDLKQKLTEAYPVATATFHAAYQRASAA